ATLAVGPAHRTRGRPDEPDAHVFPPALRIYRTGLALLLWILQAAGARGDPISAAGRFARNPHAGYCPGVNPGCHGPGTRPAGGALGARCTPGDSGNDLFSLFSAL